MAFALLVGLNPLMFGLLLEVVALMPARVPLNQSPVFFLWQDWALGAMYTKITIALTFMGPDWWLKRAIEQLYQVKLALNLSKFGFLFFSNLEHILINISPFYRMASVVLTSAISYPSSLYLQSLRWGWPWPYPMLLPTGSYPF